MSEHKIIPIVVILLVVFFGGYFLLRGDAPTQDTPTPQVVKESGSQANAANVKNAQGYYDVNSAALTDMLKNKDFSLVNVHIPYGGELADTDAFIPYDTIGQNLGKLPADKNAKIVLYCRSGSMSTEAAQELTALEYTNVYNLAGGMNAWEKSGYAIERNDRL